jgi:amino acid transporter
MFAIAGFIGFESAVVYRNEVRDPNRTIPRATYLAALIIGVFYALLSWIQIIAVGENSILEVAGADPSGLLATITDAFLGPIGSVLAVILMIGSMFAAVLSLHNILSRYFHNMSNTGLLPRSLGEVHEKHHSPHRAAVVQVTIAAIITLIIVVTSVDPNLALSWLTGMGTVAITVLMAVTCIAAIVFLRRSKSSSSLWESLIAPGLGFLGLALSAALIIAYFPMLVGDVTAEGAQFWGVASFITLGIVVLAPVIGWIQAAKLKRSAPEVYAHITERIESEA